MLRPHGKTRVESCTGSVVRVLLCGIEYGSNAKRRVGFNQLLPGMFYLDDRRDSNGVSMILPSSVGSMSRH